MIASKKPSIENGDFSELKEKLNQKEKKDLVEVYLVKINSSLSEEKPIEFFL